MAVLAVVIIISISKALQTHHINAAKIAAEILRSIERAMDMCFTAQMSHSFRQCASHAFCALYDEHRRTTMTFTMQHLIVMQELFAAPFGKDVEQ